jgi:hypothetical protein
MRLINETVREPIVAGGSVSAMGLVRRRGVTLDLDERHWVYERRTPLAVEVESSGGSRTIDLPQQTRNPLPLVAPVVGYLVVWTFFRRRKRR